VCNNDVGRSLVRTAINVDGELAALGYAHAAGDAEMRILCVLYRVLLKRETEGVEVRMWGAALGAEPRLPTH
jgi:hypothetical protein